MVISAFASGGGRRLVHGPCPVGSAGAERGMARGWSRAAMEGSGWGVVAVMACQVLRRGMALVRDGRGEGAGGLWVSSVQSHERGCGASRLSWRTMLGTPHGAEGPIRPGCAMVLVPALTAALSSGRQTFLGFLSFFPQPFDLSGFWSPFLRRPREVRCAAAAVGACACASRWLRGM